MQVETDVFYDPGLFPVQRSWKLSKEPEEDNGIFFTASIVHTLTMLEPYLDIEASLEVNEIKRKAIANYPKYKSRNDEPTFNFWQTVDPDLPFPNGNKWISNPKMRLPDDLDTSVLIAMSSDQDSVKMGLRTKMITYAERENRDESILKTLEKYEHLKAYEAWFAKEMPQTFDLCVMANAMMFVLSENYPLNQHDLATIELIKQMILDNDHWYRADDVSHHTTSVALILYHVARLMQVDQGGLFEDIKPKVTDDLIFIIQSEASEFEKMLASTSLIRLNGYSTANINHEELQEELDTFIFFSVKPFLGNPQLSFLNSLVPNINWTSKAYNYTLYLEYLYLNKTYMSNLSGTH